MTVGNFGCVNLCTKTNAAVGRCYADIGILPMLNSHTDYNALEWSVGVDEIIFFSLMDKIISSCSKIDSLDSACCWD